MRPDQRGVIPNRIEQLVDALGRAIGFRVPMYSGRVEVVSTKGMYGILIPMNNSNHYQFIYMSHWIFFRLRYNIVWTVHSYISIYYTLIFPYYNVTLFMLLFLCIYMVNQCSFIRWHYIFLRFINFMRRYCNRQYSYYLYKSKWCNSWKINQSRLGDVRFEVLISLWYWFHVQWRILTLYYYCG